MLYGKTKLDIINPTFTYNDSWNIITIGKIVFGTYYLKTIRNGETDHPNYSTIPIHISIEVPLIALANVVYHETHHPKSTAVEVDIRDGKNLRVFIEKFSGCHIYILVLGYKNNS